MSKFDLVVFGATGFTGKRAIEELARGGKRYAGISWAVAGRSQKKLEELLQEVTKKTGEDLSSIKIIIADVQEYASLAQMCAQARVVVNACGPYRLYGEPVVKAAVENKAHYVDVSGEPQFIETMQLKYDKAAREAGVYIVSACGMDSIPNDLGVVFLEQNFDGTLHAVESYLSAELNPEYKWEALRNGSINYGTWESLVYSLANYSELGPLRKQLYPDRMPTFEPKLQNRFPIHKRNGWAVPFPGADNSVVYRTQRTLYTTDQKRPVHFKAYLRFSSLLYVLLLIFGGAILLLFSKYETTRRWLLDYPRLFSFGMVAHGPARRVNENTKALFELYGTGWDRGLDQGSNKPNKTTVAKITMMDPGYGFTVLALIQSAISILKEQDKLPSQGGVLTTGVAFRNTNLIKNMQESDPNVKFEIIEAE